MYVMVEFVILGTNLGLFILIIIIIAIHTNTTKLAVDCLDT